MCMIYLRWDEALRVEEAAESLRDRLIIRLCMYVGMRAHEVAEARIEHVDPVNGWIYVPHGHTSGPRISVIDRETLKLLAIYVGSRKKGPLLLRNGGLPISRDTAYRAVRKAGERSGINKSKPIGPLVLKHTFSTTWLRGAPKTKILECPMCGAKSVVDIKTPGNIRLLQKQLGHQKLESTAHYLDWIPDEVKSEHERLFERKREASAVESVGRILRQLLQPLPNF